MLIAGRNSRLNHYWSIDECIRFFKANGFDGMEMCFEDFYFNTRPDYYEEFFVTHVVELCEETGLAITSVGNHLEFAYDDKMFEILKKIIKIVPKYGTDILITASPDREFRKLKDRDSFFRKYTERLGILLDIASDHGVRIAIEPEVNNLITTTQDFLNLCDYMKKDNLVVNLDVGHTFLTDPDMFDSIRQLGDKIAHTHVEGMRRGEHIHLMPAEGDMDLEKVISALKTEGFDGGMSLDLYVHDYEKVAADAVHQLRHMISRA